MSPDFLTPGDVPPGATRSAAEVNEQIRALWLRAGGTLSPQERTEYELLVVEWAAAIRDGIIEAA
ncbi:MULTISPECIES: hypothetical protein [Streptomyces]|uniref:Uncharacterized protein n=1 Tax=Streptomyces broussonetiae TaxID=2686304 RepID=A0ABV5EGU4_9ACTN|nr:hypothetical protein [Streptomyces sp. B93]MBC7270624.1 hypothetical protein [Streptomyces sp.]MBQ1094218.1 hypothetical protein [Streptomyces sp. B93]